MLVFSTKDLIVTKEKLADRLGVMYDFLAGGYHIPIAMASMMYIPLPEECEEYTDEYDALMREIYGYSDLTKMNYLTYLENADPHGVIPFIDTTYKVPDSKI